MTYDAALLLSFGGPDGPEDVMPFLENVTRGRNIPAARLASVAEHYHRFGGASPINAANRSLLAALRASLDMPVYWGNRNWHPLLVDTVREMAADGVRRAACFVTSAFGGWSACGQYRRDIDEARAAVGATAPVIDKLRPFYDHPGFIEPLAANVAAAAHRLAPAVPTLLFSAHSVPTDQPGAARYAAQVAEAARLVAERAPTAHGWELAWQSRSGSPSQAWLEPAVADVLDELAARGETSVVLVPVGFVADHMEVVFDLDVEAVGHADELGIRMVRAATVGTAAPFVRMVGELIAERSDPAGPVRALGRLGVPGVDCPGDCCDA